jgi:tRNA(fMet)-specific endonuclease VapC
MPQTFLLDTVAVAAILNDELALPASTLLSLPVIALGELLAGAEKSARKAENYRKIEQFAAQVQILHCDNDTARRYALVAEMLRQKGRPIPQNAMWIAAIALQHNLTLLTRDTHFEHVDGLARQSW